jgi:hypothetical protein
MALKGWMPGKREERLAMAKTWKLALVSKAAGWGIPTVQTANLDGAVSVPLARIPIQNAAHSGQLPVGGAWSFVLLRTTRYPDTMRRGDETPSQFATRIATETCF